MLLCYIQSTVDGRKHAPASADVMSMHRILRDCAYVLQVRKLPVDHDKRSADLLELVQLTGLGDRCGAVMHSSSSAGSAVASSQRTTRLIFSAAEELLFVLTQHCKH
jgi:hypothetical protein